MQQFSIQLSALSRQLSARTAEEESWHLSEKRSVLVVLVGFIDGNAAEVVRKFDQALVALVPFGAGLVKHHRSLVGPAKLKEPGFAHVSTQPACIFQVVVAGELGARDALHQTIQVVTIECPGVHGEERRARVFGQLHKFLPAIGIVLRVPDDALHLFVIDEAMKAAHAMAFNVGDHVVFYGSQVVGNRHGSWALPLNCSLKNEVSRFQSFKVSEMPQSERPGGLESWLTV